ncbi:MAG: hypothetical protein COB51_14005 [Moraxellaceae bacterium]|nr:MAG: hypothetical protein COB51_14005 [Moraxellaceae bacterium]
MRSLEDKIALVTGAGGVLGAATVRTLVAQGVKVAMCDISGARLSSLKDEFGERVNEN